MNVAVLLEWVGCSSSEFHAFPYQNPLVRVLSYMSTVNYQLHCNYLWCFRSEGLCIDLMPARMLGSIPGPFLYSTAPGASTNTLKFGFGK